jgi:hypothetical protein
MRGFEEPSGPGLCLFSITVIKYNGSKYKLRISVGSGFQIGAKSARNGFWRQ